MMNKLKSCSEVFSELTTLIISQKRQRSSACDLLVTTFIIYVTADYSYVSASLDQLGKRKILRSLDT
jgi:hypothetical protein